MNKARVWQPAPQAADALQLVRYRAKCGHVH